MKHFIHRLPYNTEFNAAMREFKGADIISATTEQVPLATGGLLAVLTLESGIQVEFAVFDWSSSEGPDLTDIDSTQYTLLFYGEGPSDGLRECRHTYWGQEGYIFYPDAELISDALEKLKKWFDMQ